MPLRRLHLLQGGVDADLLQLVDDERRHVHVHRDGPRADLHLERLLRRVAQLGHHLPRLGLLVGRLAIAGEGEQPLLGDAPDAPRLGRERCSRHGSALVHGLDQAPAVDGIADGEAHLQVVEGRLLHVHDDVVADRLSHGGDDHLGYRLLQLLGDGLGCLAGERHVELARLERGDPGAAVLDDHVAQAVEVRPALHEVVGVLHVVHVLALAPFLELEGTGADAARAVARGREVGGIDGRVARGEHQEERRLRALEMKDHGVGIRRLDGLDIGVPVLARIDPELGRRVGRFPDHVEGELDVLRREGLAVVPLDVLPEKEHEVPVVVLPRPLLRELAHDGLQAFRPLELVEDDQVVEARHGGKAGGDSGRLVHGEALGQLLAKHDVEVTARLRRLGCGGGGGPEGQSPDGCPQGGRNADKRHRISSPSPRSAATGRVTPSGGKTWRPAGSPAALANIREGPDALNTLGASLTRRVSLSGQASTSPSYAGGRGPRW